jgi:hypothetical protein
VFTISPPRIDLVISKRLEYALRQLEDESFSLGPEGITLNSDLLRDYIQILLSSLQGSFDLSEFMDNMSNGNVREALSLLMSFVGNANVPSERYVKIFRDRGSFYIPLHSVILALARGDKEHFDPSSSPIANIFDISTTDGKEHFLSALIVQFIEGTASARVDQGGYVPEFEVYTYCQSLGFQPAQIQSAIDRMADKVLVQFAPRSESDEEGPSLLRVTQKGAYTVHKLSATFAYLDAVMVDLPIVDPAVRTSVRNVRSLTERADRAASGLDYLDSQWPLIEPKPEGFDWMAHSALIREEVAKLA